MGADNSIPRFTLSNLKELQEAIGILRFSSETEWNLTTSGLIFQGGKATAAGPINFDPPFPKQVLYLNSAAGVIAADPTLEGFTAPGAGYWMAVGT